MTPQKPHPAEINEGTPHTKSHPTFSPPLICAPAPESGPGERGICVYIYIYIYIYMYTHIYV